MMHENEGRLLAYLDGALGAAERAAVDRHLAECRACADTLESLRAASARFSSAMAVLDIPAPVDAAAAEFARRRREAPSGTAQRALLRAAILILGFAAVGSAALPDSPVRRWIGSAWRGDDRPAGGGEILADSPIPPEDEPAGISILPEGGRARVFIRGMAAEARMRVVLTDGDRVAVRATGKAADARFFTAAGRIEVRGGGPGELVVEIPRTVSNAVVEVDGRPFLVKEGDSFRALVPAEQSGTEAIFATLDPKP